MKVLIIEDSQTQARVLAEAVKLAGNEVSVEETWGYAVAELAKKPDFVIADWNVPDVESTRISAIKMLERAKIPFRIFTAYASQVPREFAKYVIEKSINMGEVLAALASVDHVDVD